MRRLITIAWLVAVWVALWEELTWANLLGGALAGVAVTWIVPVGTASFERRLHPLRLLELLIYFAWKLTEASAILAWEVLTPRNRVNPGVVAIPLTSRSAGIATLVANMVSLTPGTLTLEIDEETATLFVHVLHLESVAGARRAVLEIEERALAAFPSRSDSGEQGGMR